MFPALQHDDHDANLRFLTGSKWNESAFDGAAGIRMCSLVRGIQMCLESVLI